MTKVKIAMPIRERIPGDPDEEAPSDVPGAQGHEVMPWGPQAKSSVRPIGEATRIGKTLMSKGIGPRAIVSMRNGGMERWANPHNWGIVKQLNLMDDHPIVVTWASTGVIRAHPFEQADDFVVIYPTKTMEDFVSDYQSRSPLA